MRSSFHNRAMVTCLRLITALVLIAGIAVGSVHHHGATADRHSCPVCTAAGTVAVTADPAPCPEPPLKPLRLLLAPSIAAHSTLRSDPGSARAPPSC